MGGTHFKKVAVERVTHGVMKGTVEKKRGRVELGINEKSQKDREE